MVVEEELANIHAELRKAAGEEAGRRILRTGPEEEHRRVEGAKERRMVAGVVEAVVRSPQMVADSIGPVVAEGRQIVVEGAGVAGSIPLVGEVVLIECEFALKTALGCGNRIFGIYSRLYGEYP